MLPDDPTPPAISAKQKEVEACRPIPQAQPKLAVGLSVSRSLISWYFCLKGAGDKRWSTTFVRGGEGISPFLPRGQKHFKLFI